MCINGISKLFGLVYTGLEFLDEEIYGSIIKLLQCKECGYILGKRDLF